MSDPVFTFPGGETVQPPEDAIFSADVFAGLGSMDVDEDPFAGMEPMAPFAGKLPRPPHLWNQVPQVKKPSVQPPERQIRPLTSPTHLWNQVPQVPNRPHPTRLRTNHRRILPVRTRHRHLAPPRLVRKPTPLLAAMDLQESANARKAAEPIYAQLPLFSYNGNREPIPEQIGECLRLLLENPSEHTPLVCVNRVVIHGQQRYWAYKRLGYQEVQVYQNVPWALPAAS